MSCNPKCHFSLLQKSCMQTDDCQSQRYHILHKFPQFHHPSGKGQDKHWALNFGYKTFKRKHTEEIQRVHLCCGKLQANYTLFLFSFPNGSPFAIISTWAFFIHLLPQRSRHHMFIAHLIPESHESRQKVSTFTNEQKEEKERKTKKKSSPRQRQGGGYMSHFCRRLLGFLEMAEVQTKCHKWTQIEQNTFK